MRLMRSAKVMSTIAAALVLWSAAATAQPTDEPGEGMSLEEISRMLDNPLGNLWIIFMENDLGRYGGRPTVDRKWVNTGLIQPVLPVPLTDDWNLVTRPILPIVTAPEWNLSPRDFGDCPGNCNSEKPPSFINVSSDRETELGDLIMWSMLSPAEPMEMADGGKFVWGLGPTFSFPTATHDKFGSQKFSMGPSNIVLRLPPEDGRWTFGLFQQHLFSVAGSDSRDTVTRSQFQYIWWYSLPVEGQWSIGAFPMVDVNWEADNDDKLSFPLGLGFSTTFFAGPMPIRVGAEFDYYVAQTDSYGPRFMIKFFVVPVIPRLVKAPIFGG